MIKLRTATGAEFPISWIGVSDFDGSLRFEVLAPADLPTLFTVFSDPAQTATLTRVYDVPAGTGLVVRGVEGGHYEIPAGNGSSVLSNLLVGTTRSKDLPVEEGDKTNCILADGSFGLGFYPTSGGILPAGKAYLPLPSSSLSQAGEVKGVTFVFEDATGIGIVESDGQDGIWYTVDGKMLQHKPFTPGVYVRNGKKVIVK